MEGNGTITEDSNDALSQSYIQAIERVAQEDNRGSVMNFELPKEVVEKREKVWSNFFEKYTNKIPNEVELNMFTMEPVETNTDEENEEEKDDEEEDEEKNDEEHKEYYSKCRAPIRKLPALIQYWVDTGNPPYQLTGDHDHSDTGSSLSEGEYSRSRQSAALRKSIEDPKFNENSPSSSVDTAAYVLSNANVTKKAKTQEIVEGAKRSNEELCAKIATPIREDPNVTMLTDKASKQSGNSPSNEIPKSPSRQAPLNCMSSPGDTVMLCEVLPALQQFDDLLEKSKELKEPRVVPSRLRPIRKPTKGLAAKSEIEAIVENSCPVARTEPGRNSMNSTDDSKNSIPNRRKLYTGRDSPCDLIMTENTSSFLTTGPLLHPALEPVVATKNQTFSRRSRAKRKRVRPSLPRTVTMSKILQNGIRSNSQESQELVQDDRNNNNNDEKEGHGRYTEFFESLGLTPKNTPTDNKDKKIATRLSRTRNLCRVMSNEPARTICQVESPDSVESPTKKTNSPKIASKSTNKVTQILGNKTLTVRITRLPDEVFARYGQQERQSPDMLNIEVLTTETNDSDSSTILLFSCDQDNNNQTYDSDCSSYQNISVPTISSDLKNAEENKYLPRTKSSFSNKRMFTNNLECTSSGTETTKPSAIDSSGMPPEGSEISRLPTLLVRLEKLPVNQQPKVLPPSIESNVDPKPQDLRVKNVTVTLNKIDPNFVPKPRDMRATNLEKSPLIGPSIPMDNSESCVTPGPRSPGIARKIEKLKTNQKDRFSFGFNFRTSPEPDEDCFARLIQENAVTPFKNRDNRNKSIIATGQGNLREAMNGESEASVEEIKKSHLGIAISSDEDEDDRVTFSQKFRSKRSPRKIDTKLIHEYPKRSKNGRNINDELMDDLRNDNTVSAGLKNRPDKSERGKEREEVPTEKRENSNSRKSARQRLTSTWFSEGIKTKDGSEESSDCAKIIDFRKKKKFGDYTDGVIESRSKESHSLLNSNFDRGKRKAIERESPCNLKKSRVTRSLKFCTRLSSDSEAHLDVVSKKQNVVGTNKKSIRDKPSLSKADPIIELEKSNEKRNNTNESEKKSLRIFDDGFDKADEELNEKSVPLIASHNSTSEYSREKVGISPSRSKNNIKTRARETAMKRLRRTRILRTPNQSETDDDNSDQPQINVTKSTKHQLSMNGKPSKASSKPGDNGASTLPDTRQSYLPHFFPNILEGSRQDIDNIFTSNGNYQQKSDFESRKKLVKPMINKSRITARKSTITFRTQLTSNSESDTDL